jgi:hypothetical protein
MVASIVTPSPKLCLTVSTLAAARLLTSSPNDSPFTGIDMEAVFPLRPSEVLHDVIVNTAQNIDIAMNADSLLLFISIPSRF